MATAHLTLRAVTPADRAAVFALFADPRVAVPIHMAPCAGLAQADELIAGAWPPRARSAGASRSRATTRSSGRPAAPASTTRPTGRASATTWPLPTGAGAGR